MKVLSLFDGMGCAMLAMIKAGITVNTYDAYEIDKYAITVTQHNFPMVRHHGDVFKADFTEYEGVDYLMGGSPCTYWSIAQKNNRETEASGLGWELFCQYVRALREAKPKYFVYENNKSMSKSIKESISDTFGFEPICINSALVSAQNRQRLYWVGIRQLDGTYKKADIKQPDDKGILLKDILETKNEVRDNDKTNALTTVSNANAVAQPVRVGAMPRPNGELSSSQGMRIYAIDGKSVTQSAQGGGWGAKTGLYAVPYEVESLSDDYYHGDKDTQILGKIECKNTSNNKGQPAQGTRVYKTNNKSVCLDADSRKYYVDNYNGEAETVIGVNGKSAPVYTVKDRQITIKGKQYPIKLADGNYIIRKLTVRECMRLQTVPEWYDLSCISNTQAYKCLGNGWTVDVIAHILSGLNVSERNENNLNVAV